MFQFILKNVNRIKNGTGNCQTNKNPITEKQKLVCPRPPCPMGLKSNEINGHTEVGFNWPSNNNVSYYFREIMDA